MKEITKDVVKEELDMMLMTILTTKMHILHSETDEEDILYKYSFNNGGIAVLRMIANHLEIDLDKELLELNDALLEPK